METDRIRAVVVKFYDVDPRYIERAWIACTMSQSTYEIIGEEDWQRWRNRALDLVLADWQSYEIREVVLEVPQEQLEALFAVTEIPVTVATDKEQGDAGSAMTPSPRDYEKVAASVLAGGDLPGDFALRVEWWAPEGSSWRPVGCAAYLAWKEAR